MGCTTSTEQHVIDAQAIDDSIHVMLSKDRGCGHFVPRAPHPLLDTLPFIKELDGASTVASDASQEPEQLIRDEESAPSRRQTNKTPKATQRTWTSASFPNGPVVVLVAPAC